MSNHRPTTILRLVIILLAVVAAGARPLAQETTATITGRVADAADAAVVAAKVTVSDEARGFSRTYETSEDGVYTATLLPPGTYTVTVEAQGFRRHVQNNVQLSVNDRRPIDVRLEAGEFAETVTVTGDAPLLQESPTQQGLVSGTQVRQLPLNNRNFAQLATLAPGVTTSNPSQIGFGGLSVVSFSINGGRTSAVNYLVDGARNVDTGSNLTLLTVPSVDAIQEFSVLTSNYAPEFGRNGGGVINVVTRQGTNEFHGSLYEFHRNDALNARDPFITRPLAGLGSAADPRFKQPLRYNNFGGTIGGPVYLPRFGEGGPRVYDGRDRTFFFFSQEFRRIRATSVPVGTVATNAQRAGVFSTSVTDPLTGQPFPRDAAGNFVVPSGRFDPNAVALMNFILGPNEGANQFRRVTPVAANFRQSIFRFDHSFGPATTLTARYIRDDFTRDDPGGNPFVDPFNPANISGTLFPNVAAQRTATPGDNLVVSLKFALSPTAINEVAFDYARNLIQTTFAGTGTRANAAGFTSPELFESSLQGALPTVSIDGVQGLAFTSPQSIENPSYTFRDNLTWVRGNHTLKFGGFASYEEKNENAGNNLNGTFTFLATRPGGTGNAFANFLLGLPSTYSEDQNEVRVQLRYTTYEFYAQDSWKVTPRLTLDYGARYSLFNNPIDADDLLISFLPNRYDPARAVRIDPVSGNIVAGSGDRFNGIVFAGENSPYGRRVQTNRRNTLGPRLGFAYDLFGGGTTILRGGFGVYYDRTLVGIVEQNAFLNPRISSRVTIDNPTLANPGGGVARTTIPPVQLFSTGDPFEVPRTHQFSLGLQRALWENAVAEVSYVGTQGRNLLRLVDINQAQPGERAAATARLRAAGTIGPAQTASINFVRPFLGYTSILDRRTDADSDYNSLQMRFDQRLVRGLQFGAVYTFAKNLTTASTDRSDRPQNPFDEAAERAPSQFDRTHVFTANFFYELPFFRGRTDLAGALLGGFQLAGIYTLQSGTPLNIVQTGDPLSIGAASGTVRPDLVGDPEGPGTALQWFNTAAFRAVTAGYGSAGRGLVRGPGINNLDISVYKTFRFTEDTNLQLRAEFFNALNHTQYNNPGLTQGTATFGVITSARDARIIQFGLKFNY